MSASLHQYAPRLSEHILTAYSDARADKSLPRHNRTLRSTGGDQNRERPLQELVWILISLLLLLYVAASYVYWAKIESAWPIFRGL
jgi:hypothetical protein